METSSCIIYALNKHIWQIMYRPNLWLRLEAGMVDTMPLRCPRSLRSPEKSESRLHRPFFLIASFSGSESFPSSAKQINSTTFHYFRETWIQVAEDCQEITEVKLRK